MAATRRAACFTCGNEIGQVTCDGCSKTFCLNDFNGHRQKLDTELAGIEIDRDAFRQSLTEAIAEPKNNALIALINRWEDESHDKIRQVAQEARQTLEQYLREFIAKLENKLKTLTDQVQASRNKNAFSELDLNQWRNSLAKMTEQLEKPPNIRIMQDVESLVTGITVYMVDRSEQTEFKERINMTMHRENDSSKRTIPCSFCNEEISSCEIGEHLMFCGNKTDQCSNCQKFIRRAIFLYHYENNCAPDPDVATTENTERQTTPPSEKPNIMYKCEYCGNLCENQDRRQHKENCVKNPKNQKKRQESFNDENTNYHAGHHRKFLGNSKQSNDNEGEDVGIPCEWCLEEIPFDYYEQHAEQCRDKEHRRLEARPERRERNTAYHPVNDVSYATPRPPRSAGAKPSSATMRTPSANETAQCIHCEKVMSVNGITNHKLICLTNIKRNKN